MKTEIKREKSGVRERHVNRGGGSKRNTNEKKRTKKD
jgi:hypothetical protein